MSGLEKFQANESWRADFMKLLLAERKITPQPTELIQESQRFSLDIDADLAIILEEKKIPIPTLIEDTLDITITSTSNQLISEKRKAENTESSEKMFRSEDKENRATNTNKRQSVPAVKFSDKNLATVKRYTAVSQYEDTLLEDPEGESEWQRTSDESFEALEHMCNKTASDPDSTLFQYLHSDQKAKIVESAKKRSRSGDKPTLKCYDAEARALQRLLDELSVEEQMQLENESPLKGIDVTALEDIEAPSRLWENTITNETLLQTSPVKMVGLLRPSTILEEYDREEVSSSSDISSSTSFQSASKGVPSEVSCYETAHDSASGNDTASSVTTNAASSMLLDNNTDKQTKSNISPIKSMISDVNDKLIDLNNSVDLIDLEKTFAPLSESPHSSITEETIANEAENVAVGGELEEEIEIKGMSVEDFIAYASASAFYGQDQIDLSDSDESVIEIFSDDDDVDPQDASENTAVVPNAHKSPCPNVHKSPEIKFENLSATEACSSIRSSIDCRSPNLDDYKENYATLERSNDTSLNLNDTMEEVDYIMKKGMQYLAASAAAKLPTQTKPEASPNKTTTKLSPLKNKQHTFLMSPKADSRYRSPSPMLHKQKLLVSTSTGKCKTPNAISKTADKPIAKPKPLNQFSKEMKPFPKLEIFKKPTTTGMSLNTANMRHKEASTKNFSHIVSPIRAYIKQSTNTPLMFTINDINKNPNSLNSMRELEHESRLYKPNFDNVYAAGATVTPIDVLGPSSLPKKAYISSEFKHIVDERTPVTIPGGKQFQKHIETAMLPAVLKHEGKMKMPGLTSIRPGETARSSSPSPHIPRRTDASLADLSLMSGDISMYTIKDARKF